MTDKSDTDNRTRELIQLFVGCNTEFKIYLDTMLQNLTKKGIEKAIEKEDTNASRGK